MDNVYLDVVTNPARPYQASIAIEPGAAFRAPADRLVYLAVVLGYVLLLPVQLNLMIGGSEVPPYRFILIPSTALIINQVLQSRLRLGWPDLLILGSVGWIWLAMSISTGGTEGLTASIANTVDIAIAYFFARVTFRTPRDFRLFLILISPGIFFVALVITLESVMQTPFTYNFFSSLFGGRPLKLVQRLGLMRAFGPFPHPILAGIFFASFLALYALSGIRGWPRLLGIVAALGSFFTVSSAAILALVVTTALLAYNWLVQRVANLSWRMFLVAAGLAGFVLEVFSQNGAMSVLTRYASLNTATARNRILIWEFGTQNVAKHPWFGIGYKDWERPIWMLSSVDHYWLLLAMQFGVIVPVMIALAVGTAVLRASRASVVLPDQDGALLRGIAITLGVFAFGVISVSIWESVQIWFYMLIGAAISLTSSTFATRQIGRVDQGRASPSGFQQALAARRGQSTF